MNSNMNQDFPRETSRNCYSVRQIRHDPPMTRQPTLVLLGLLLAGCATRPLTVTPSEHLGAPPPRPVDLPKPVEHPAFLPKPSAQPKTDTYSVVVSNVPVRDLMFALARDARINVDVHPLVKGTVTINALNQTLPQILERVANQVSMRYSLENGVLSIMPDRPFLKTYTMDYVNMTRSVKGSVSVATSLSGNSSSNSGSTSNTGGSSSSSSSSNTSAGGGNTSSNSGSNNSEITINNTSENNFWEKLEKNLREIIIASRRVSASDKKERQEQDQKDEQARNGAVAEKKQEELQRKQEERLKTAQAVASAGAGAPKLFSLVQGQEKQATESTEDSQGNDVFVHVETGTITINATSREHAKVQEYLNRVASGSRRQVLIEATIVEVSLSDQYQAGIDWKIFKNTSDGTPQDNRGNLTQSSLGNTLSNLPYTLLTYKKAASGLLNGADITATIKALEQFGKTKVISSPKIMALNNQTALLKVVDEKVYFTVSVQVTPATKDTPEKREYISTPQKVPVGIVMSVTPQISENDAVSLNVRPTITRLTGYRSDPSGQVLVPEIQVREVESTLRLASNETAVLGGLIQDQIQNQRTGTPFMSRLPWGVGDLFSTRDDVAQKTELVIFLRPVVVRDPSLNGDLADFKQYLPQDDFFKRREDEISAFPTGLPAR